MRCHLALAIVLGLVTAASLSAGEGGEAEGDEAAARAAAVAYLQAVSEGDRETALAATGAGKYSIAATEAKVRLSSAFASLSKAVSQKLGNDTGSVVLRQNPGKAAARIDRAVARRDGRTVRLEDADGRSVMSLEASEGKWKVVAQPADRAGAAREAALADGLDVLTKDVNDGLVADARTLERRLGELLFRKPATSGPAATKPG